ncbi:MAG: ABC transporter permease [Gammaproteobacteria bacterium]|nr:ABC transporter permease [Gammaproteobacteria bacterium]
MIKNITSFFNELWIHNTVLRQLISQQLILRYRRTALGYLWTLINPLVMMSIMAVVFSTLFKADLKTFAVFLFAGMIPWNFFSSVVTQSGTSFINNEGLIKKIYLPKGIFPLSIAFSLLIDSALSFLALFVIILVIGGSLSWAVLFIPVAYLLLFFFALGIGLIMSVATVFFRDLQHVILIAMQALFFLTPILYKPDSLVGKVAWLVDLNPVVPFIELFRAPLFQASLPSLNVILLAVLFSISAMFVGLFIFLRQEKQIVFRL